MKLELFNLSYFIAFALLAGVFRYDERKAYKGLRVLLDRDPQAGSASERLIELDDAHTKWMRYVERLEVARWLLLCELVGFLIWCAWTGIKALWGVA